MVGFSRATKPMKTKEEFFQFEKQKQKEFNKLYQSFGWSYKRIFGKGNKKYDCVILVNGEWIKVEEKFQEKEWPSMAVELIQDTETNSPGWLYYTEADWILYGMGEIIYLVQLQKLKEFIKKYKDKFDTKISEKGWGKTLNLIIPWTTIMHNGIGKRIK